MKKLKSTYLALTAALLLPLSANADYIEGDITFGGSAVGDDWTTATLIDFLFVNVTGGIGDFGSVAPGTIVLIQDPFVFDPTGSGYVSLINPFWAFTSGGLDYSFSLEDWTINDRTESYLDLSGYGTVSITGFEPTAFNWTLSLDEAGTALAAVFMKNSPTTVPEPGTLALFAIGLAGMGLARRRRTQ